MKCDLRVIDYRAGHLDCLNAKAVFHGELELEARIETALKANQCIVKTVFMGRQPLAVLGLTLIREGFAEAWSLTSEEVRDVPISFHRVVLGILSAYEKALRLTRIQMTVRENYEEGKRWARSLGFQEEGLMRKFGPDGSHHFLYARCLWQP
jgi:hypothetical protein